MNEIEKQFFETFGVEPVPIYSKLWHIRDKYPQITDHILLELICIAHTSPVITFTSRNIWDLKEEVLLVLCNWVNHRDIKHQVQALFKED